MKKFALLLAVIASASSLAPLSAATRNSRRHPSHQQSHAKLQLPTEKGRHPLLHFYLINPLLKYLTAGIVPYIKYLQYRWDIPETEAGYIKKQSAALEYYDRTGDATPTEINALYGYKDKGFGYRHPFKRDLLLYVGLPVSVITGVVTLAVYLNQQSTISHQMFNVTHQ